MGKEAKRSSNHDCGNGTAMDSDRVPDDVPNCFGSFDRGG